jgi:hypothetical protein
MNIQLAATRRSSINATTEIDVEYFDAMMYLKKMMMIIIC